MQVLKDATKRMNFKINGHLVQGLVTVKYDYETDMDFSYWDDEAKKQTIKDLDAGRVAALYVQVEVHFEGLTGLDSLGQVFVRNSAFDKDLTQTVSDHAMIQTAIDDLTKQVLELAPKLQRFVKGAA